MCQSRGERAIVRRVRRPTERGFEIGAHSVTHPDLSAASEEVCEREVAGSVTTLERLLGAPVRTFTPLVPALSVTVVVASMSFEAVVSVTVMSPPMSMVPRSVL